MRFKKDISRNQKLLQTSDLKLIRAVEDIIIKLNLLSEMDPSVQALINKRIELRTSGGEPDAN